MNDNISNDAGFSYFPQAYKMSTEIKPPVQSNFNNGSFTFQTCSPVDQPPTPASTCVQLDSAEKSKNSLKRKHSEMVHIEKLERVDVSDFHMPTPMDQTDIENRRRMNKREAKMRRRQRIMTETVQDFQGRVGFCPTKKSEQTLSSIEILRNSNLPKPQISSIMSMHQYSVDESGSVISRGSRKAQVKLLKVNKEISSSNQEYNRMRLQTF